MLAYMCELLLCVHFVLMYSFVYVCMYIIMCVIVQRYMWEGV